MSSKGTGSDKWLDVAPASLDRMNDAAPHGRVLSNGRYWALVTGAGTGVSQCGPIAVTRWAADRVGDGDGIHVYLRDLDSGEVWSLGTQPMVDSAGRTTARAAAGSIVLGRRARGIEARCEICVAPDADAEVRRVTVANTSPRARRIEVTCCAEVVLGDRAADYAHQAFAKLFVETGYDAEREALTARRRPRGANEAPSWMAAALHGHPPVCGELDFETDRCRFLGRGRSAADPAAMRGEGLSRTVGNVLDPIFALRRRLFLAPAQQQSLAFALAVAADRDAAVAAVARRRSSEDQDATFQAATELERKRQRRCGLGIGESLLLQDLATAMLYQHPLLRAPAAVTSSRADQASIGSFGLARDTLLVVLPTGHALEGAAAARVDAVLRAVRYWGELGLSVSLVVVCDDAGCRSSARPCPLHARAGKASISAPARVFVRRGADLGPRTIAALLSRAQWVVGVQAPDLATAAGQETPAAAKAKPLRGAARIGGSSKPLLFDNGLGGFTADGGEYVIRVRPGQPDGLPPMPWVNVISNPHLGLVVSESGAACTWQGNSRQNKLTPWNNDPVVDAHDEALYLRDDESGHVWSPQPGPIASGADCEVRHGLGYSTWRQRCEGLDQQVTTFVAAEDPLRFVEIRLRNRSDRPRRISVTFYVRLLLGVHPADDSRFVVTEADRDCGVLMARNPMSEDHHEEIAFAAVAAGAPARPTGWTTDRASFLGRNGSTRVPAAVIAGRALDGRCGEGLDPCFALQAQLEMAARGEAGVAYVLGQACDRRRVSELVECARRDGAVEQALAEVRAGWKSITGALQVQTPAAGLDVLVGHWLPYQTLGCRIWGRSGFYQSGGALGFRDQLQDAAAMVWTRPDLLREQILLHAAHQFVEGDVLHWWHPPADRGTRRRFSDDLLWLPYVTAFYAAATGDDAVLDADVGFARARTLAEGEDEAYLRAERADKSASLYEHCCAAIDRSLTRGAHGLPLMGTGDWNDGMNRVGRLGRGESVWLGFFLATILESFAPICQGRGDLERARNYRGYRATLVEALNDAGWDGAWYRRAYYDDGSALGSAADDECRIDAVAQSWAVLSGVATRERAEAAMAAVERLLVDAEAGIVRLLAPPFDRGGRDPGYIKGYLPGIRENGGQYTHAAIWVARAYARLGRRDRAAALLEMLSPTWHARDARAAAVYEVEPYVVAADVYGVEPHLGRGGWTWYTGSAGWMYRTVVESVLGLTIERGRWLRLRPCVPDAWPGYRLSYRLPGGRTRYDVEVTNPDGTSEAVVAATLDGRAIEVADGDARWPLCDDGGVHRVEVVLGAPPA